VDLYIGLRRYERISIHNVMDGIQVRLAHRASSPACDPLIIIFGVFCPAALVGFARSMGVAPA